MKLFVRIETLDHKEKKYECVDFPYTSGSFWVLHLAGFRRKYVRQESVRDMETYFA